MTPLSDHDQGEGSVRHEIIIRCSEPAQPKDMSDRMWVANQERLGFVVGGVWKLQNGTISAILCPQSDGYKVREGLVYRAKDAGWAICQALKQWRTEMALLLGDVEYEGGWQQPVQVSSKPVQDPRE